ncbi:MAG: hypothetical protein ACRD1X_11755 [Vicinamibacteria bacterium]
MPSIEEHGVGTEDPKPEASAPDASARLPKPSGAERDVSEGVSSASAFELASRILVGIAQAIEDGADLLGASVREELGRFRTDFVRSLVAAVSLAIGGGLLTGGLALMIHAWIGSWALVLLILGAVYVSVGAWLFRSSASGNVGNAGKAGKGR